MTVRHKTTASQALNVEGGSVTSEDSIVETPDFLAIVSNQFRTPLNVIMGYAEMIRDGLLGNITDEQRKGLQEIVACSDELLAIITKFLQASSIESLPPAVKREEVILNQMVEELKSDCGLLDSKDVPVVWECPTELPVLKTDRSKLKEILQTLVANQLKSTRGGKVTVSIRLLSRPSRVEFRITGTGTATPDEAVPRLYAKSDRLHASITRFGEPGLDIYIAQKLARLIGGEFNITPSATNCSAFRVILPANA